MSTGQQLSPVEVKGAVPGKLGLTVPPRAARGPHMLGIELPTETADRVGAALAQHRVVISQRGSSLRISPHLHTNTDDIDRLFDTLQTAL